MLSPSKVIFDLLWRSKGSGQRDSGMDRYNVLWRTVIQFFTLDYVHASSFPLPLEPKDTWSRTTRLQNILTTDYVYAKKTQLVFSGRHSSTYLSFLWWSFLLPPFCGTWIMSILQFWMKREILISNESCFYCHISIHLSFPDGPVVKSPPGNTGDARDWVWFLNWEDPGEGNDNPHQYSCLENSTEKGVQSLWDHKELDMTECAWKLGVRDEAAGILITTGTQ